MVGKHEGHGHRWEDNETPVLQEQGMMVWYGSGLAQNVVS